MDKYKNEIICGDCIQVLKQMKEEQAPQFDIIITSPPYNLGKVYSQEITDDQKYDDYLKFSYSWMSACFDVAKDDCRFCLNIPMDTNKYGHQSVLADFVTLAKKIGWRFETTIIWDKAYERTRTSWGSWLSASAPCVLAPVEVIVVFYKKFWKKQRQGISDVEKMDFLQWKDGVWAMHPEGHIEHPAPFPLELPRRCLKMFSYVDDYVLDPFSGSGSVAVCCKQIGRDYCGIEINQEYIKIAYNRLYLGDIQNRRTKLC